MKDIKILDCTLRDGGRGFGNAWGDDTIKSISRELTESGIDMIEVGFLWYFFDGVSRVNTTIFQSFDEMKQFQAGDKKFIAYIEYILFKEENHTILPAADTCVEGIRLGLLKDEIEEAEETMRDIISKGYRLFVQGINAMSYSDQEWIEFIDIVNRIKPYAFAIVDTYGSMECDDLERIFRFIDARLDKDITISLHSHNNRDQAKDLAKRLIEISADRKIVLDSTLDGIGMGAGNLSTIEIAEILNNVNGENIYHLDLIRNATEQYIEPIRKVFVSGASWMSHMASERWMPSMSLSYIVNNYKDLSDEEMKLLIALSSLKVCSKKKICSHYRAIMQREDLSQNYEIIKKMISQRDLVIIGKGPSYNDDTWVNHSDFSQKVLIFANHPNHSRLKTLNDRSIYFFSNQKPFNAFIENNKGREDRYKIICLSSLKCKEAPSNMDIYRVNLFDIQKGSEIMADDAVFMCINMAITFALCNKLELAGFDGTSEEVTRVMKKFYKQYLKMADEKIAITFLTESAFDYH